MLAHAVQNNRIHMGMSAASKVGLLLKPLHDCHILNVSVAQRMWLTSRDLHGNRHVLPNDHQCCVLGTHRHVYYLHILHTKGRVSVKSEYQSEPWSCFALPFTGYFSLQNTFSSDPLQSAGVIVDGRSRSHTVDSCSLTDMSHTRYC